MAFSQWLRATLKSNIMRRSLLWRIALPYAGLLLLILGGISIYLYVSLRSFYMDQVGQRLLAEARLAGNDLGEVIATNPNDPFVNTFANRAATAVGGRITVILADGRVVSESDRSPGELENHLGRPEVQQALDNKEALRVRYSNTLGEELLYAAVPIVWEGQPVAVMRVAHSLASLQSTLNRLVGSVILVAAVAAVLVIILAVLIAGYTLRPLRALSDSVEKIGGGGVPEIVPPRGSDEISQLQTAFREMYTQLRQRFEELRAERGKLEAVLMNMTDGILIVDAEGMVRLLNPAVRRLFDVKDGDDEMHSLVEVVRHHQIVELWRKCLQSETQQAMTLETSTGRSNLQAIATPLSHELSGSVLMVFQDLTRIRRLETVRRDFISNVSHELRTPLASLKALTETLQEGALDDPPAARRFLSQMENEIDNLTQMVRELLELSRIESGRVPFRFKSCQPCDLIVKAVDRMRLQAERAGLDLILEETNCVTPVLADSDRIEQVLVNLLHNAVKFTLPGGKISVGCQTRDHDVLVYVRDSGVGIAPEDLTRIFERFYKADRSRSGGGTGLGLSIARHVIESHGGLIWAESRVSQGSSFCFTLPKMG